MATKARMFGSIAKVEDLDDGTIMVEGIANAPTPDSDGETFTAECMKAAIPDYMEKRRALREMHQPICAGVTKAMWVDEDGFSRIRAHVIDPVSVKKVQAGALKMFSIEGVIPPGGRDAVDRKIVHKLKLREVSLVDVGAHPDAMIETVKLDTLKEAPMAQEQTTAGTTPEITEKAEGLTEQTALDTIKKWCGEEISDARSALDALGSIFYLLMKEGAAGEAAQASDLKVAADKLRAFIASEILEDTSNPTDTPAVVALADGPKPGEDGVAKAGAKYSAATKEAFGKLRKAMQDAQECMKAFDDMDGDEGKKDDDAAEAAKMDTSAAGEDLVAKAAGLTDQVAKLEGEKADLVAKLDTLTSEKEKLAAELDKAEKGLAGVVDQMKAKGFLKTVDKGQDSKVTKSDSSTPSGGEAEPTDPLALIRKVQASGGTIINPSAR